MHRKVKAVLFLAFFLLSAPLYAADADFKMANPDVDKYAFVRDFIMSLSYYNRVALRFKGQEKAKAEGRVKDDIDQVLKMIKDLTLDNTELRIARNYLSKFSASGNALIRDVTQRTVGVYDQFLRLNSRERELWMGFYRFKNTNEPADYSEQDFVARQLGLVLEKRETAKGLVEASVLVQKVLLSAERCDTDACKELALTQEERYKLIKKLDTFASANLDWGLKAGQTTLEGCIAAIREILEDPLYVSRKAENKK